MTLFDNEISQGSEFTFRVSRGGYSLRLVYFFYEYSGEENEIAMNLAIFCSSVCGWALLSSSWDDLQCKIPVLRFVWLVWPRVSLRECDCTQIWNCLARLLLLLLSWETTQKIRAAESWTNSMQFMCRHFLSFNTALYTMINLKLWWQQLSTFSSLGLGFGDTRKFYRQVSDVPSTFIRLDSSTECWKISKHVSYNFA